MRPRAQANPGGLRLSNALGAGQSAAHVRRVRTPHESSGLRLGYARPYELTKAGGVRGEQVIRRRALSIRKWKFVREGPGGRSSREIRVRSEKNETCAVTTLTKRMAEDLSEYFSEIGVKCRYLHSEVENAGPHQDSA